MEIPLNTNGLTGIRAAFVHVHVKPYMKNRRDGRDALFQLDWIPVGIRHILGRPENVKHWSNHRLTNGRSQEVEVRLVGRGALVERPACPAGTLSLSLAMATYLFPSNFPVTGFE